MKRPFYILGWVYVAACAWLVVAHARLRNGVANGGSSVYAAPTPDAVQWFRRMKPYCNSVEVQTVQQQSPPPNTAAGAGYHAACYALAGRIDDARRVIDKLSPDDRYKAAGIVFDVGHPVADAGDDRSAGPIMELVIDYWPNHYMALYHAGMAEYMLGQRDLAKHNLTEFLRLYHENDGWHANGVEVLARLNDVNRSIDDPRRPREPQQ
jgi:tetratricopeptide (TPR) repeat protein